MKLLILDFDGTVGDTRALITHTMQQTLCELGLPSCSEEACSKVIGLPLAESFRTLLPLDQSTGEQCAEVYRRIFAESHKPGLVPVFPHVLEEVKAFHGRGVVVTLASSRGHASLEAFVKEMDLTPYITYILGADDVSHSKPDPEPVFKTLREFSVAPQDALVVGDTKFDILMGKRAGTRTCGVTYGNGSRAELVSAGADALVDDFRELQWVWEREPEKFRPQVS